MRKKKKERLKQVINKEFIKKLIPKGKPGPTVQVKNLQAEKLVRETSPLLRMRFKMESDRRDELKNRKVQDAFDLLINPVKQEGLNSTRKRNNSFDAKKSALIPCKPFAMQSRRVNLKI